MRFYVIANAFIHLIIMLKKASRVEDKLKLFLKNDERGFIIVLLIFTHKHVCILHDYLFVMLTRFFAKKYCSGMCCDNKISYLCNQKGIANICIFACTALFRI